MTRHEDANEAWREGRIAEARQRYEAILESDPDDWAASFQLAWLDAAFGELTTDRANRLARPGLTDSARHAVEALRGTAQYPTPLDGPETDWDIDALRARGGQETYSSWWESHGKAAAKVGLYGVAAACLDEAESREPNGAYWDPPGWTHSLPALLDQHLSLVEHPFE